MRREDPLFGGLHIRDLAGEALAEDGREGVYVAAVGRAFPAGLLGRDVVDRPDEVTRFGHLRVVVALGEPEVGQIGVVADADQHVLGLDVAMGESLRVRGVERLGHLRQQAQRPPVVELAPQDQILERGALDHAHRQEQPVVGLAGLVDRHDVGVVERRLQ